MTEDDLFARRPMGMRMAMVVRQWRAIIDSAITDTGLTQSSWTVLMQLHQLGDNVSVSELAEVQGIELPPLMRTLTQLEKQGAQAFTPQAGGAYQDFACSRSVSPRRK